MKIKIIYIFLFLLISITFKNSYSQTMDDYIPVTSDVKYQYIGTYDIDRLNKIMTTELAEFAEFKMEYPSARYPVKLYRIVYSSVIPEKNNQPTIASGLLAIPETGHNTMPVVSYQHGTVFDKTWVPSFPEESYETRLEIAQFCGQGYILIGADYFGKGLSPEKDSYVVKQSTQQACYDMLIAARYVTDVLGIKMSELFLSGWSQGSYCTLAFLNKLESVGIPVKGAAIASAPVDLFASLNRWIHNPQAIDAVYLPGCINLMLNSYQEYYNLTGLIEFAIKPEYQQIARDFYLNKITWEEFSEKTPAKVKDFLNDEFMNSTSLSNNRFMEIIQNNQAYRWRSVTPLQTYFGDIDEVVPEYIATLPAGYQNVMGGAIVTAIPAGAKADHRGTFMYAVAHQKKWFDELLENKLTGSK